MNEFRTDNGVRVVINPAPFGTVKELRKCIIRQFKKQNIDIEKLKSVKEIKNIVSGNLGELLNLIKNLLCDIELDEQFEGIMTKCLSYCTYKDITINDDLFDNIPAAQEDYDKIRFECIKENLKPFFKKPLGLLKTLNDTTENNQE